MSFIPPTPTRKALRCRGLRVNRCPAGHPPTAAHPESALPSARRCAAIWVTLRVLMADGRAQSPDGDVRQDISRFPPHVVSGRGHRFTAPDGLPRIIAQNSDGCAQNPDGCAQNRDGDVRQDIDLLVARDTAAHSAQVSRVHDSPACGVRLRTPIYRSGWCVSVLSHRIRMDAHRIRIDAHRIGMVMSVRTSIYS